MSIHLNLVAPTLPKAQPEKYTQSSLSGDSSDLSSGDLLRFTAKLNGSELARRRMVRNVSIAEPPFLTARQLREKVGAGGLSEVDRRHMSAMEDILRLYPNLSQREKIFAGTLLLDHLESFQNRVSAAIYESVQAVILQELGKFKYPIQPNVHLIWVGSLPEAVKTNVRMFLESTTPMGGESPLTFNLGYDPRGYMAHRLKASLYRIAQSHVNNLPLGPDRDRRYRLNIIKLQNEAYASIKSSDTSEEFSRRAINFIVSRLGGDRKKLEEELQSAEKSFINFEKEINKEYKDRVKLRDLSKLIHKDHPLYEYYLREMWLRGNLPSAADMARSELLFEYGGTYIDVDVSPLLREGIFGIPIEHLAEKVLEFIAQASERSLPKWRAWLEAAKVQAVHNFIAQRPQNRMSGIFSREIFDRMRNDEALKDSVEGFRIVEEYIRKIEAAPAHYLARLAPEPSVSDIRHFFQPFKQPRVFPSGLSMQERPGGLFGYDIGVIHGREGAPAFFDYRNLVIERYQEIEKGGVLWDKVVPATLDNNPELSEKYNGYYRLDGLVSGLNATEYITGPRSFSQAAIDAFGKIQDGELMRYWEQGHLSSQDRKLFPLFVESTALQFDTPEDAKSAWRGEVLPRRFSFSQLSKYTTQIVLQLDHNTRSIEAARLLDNRHQNSRWFVLDHKGRLIEQTSGEKAESGGWDRNTRIVLVGTLHDDKATLGEKSPMKVAEIIAQLMPDPVAGYPVERIKIVGWSMDLKTGEGISSKVGVAGMKGFSLDLLRFLEKKGMSVHSIKGYDGAIEIDVCGRTWVVDSRGLWRHNSSLLRFLVEVKEGRPLMSEVPMKNLFEDVDILPSTPALSVGRHDRRAVILIASKKELKSNKVTDFREAVENLRIKHPGTEFYALSREDNGKFKQWKYGPVSRHGEWSENWQLSSGLSQTEYEKILLLGHGKEDGGEISGAQAREIASGVSELMRDVSKVDHIGVLVCNSNPEFGTLLYEHLGRSVVGRITGSELPIYIAGKSMQGVHGIRPGSRLYRDQADGKVKHGVHHAKWEVKRNENGQVEITSYLLPSTGDGVEISTAQKFAGPFSYARQQQFLAQKEAVVASWGEKVKRLREYAISHLVRTSYENASDLMVLIPKLGKKNGEFSVPVVNLKTQAEVEVTVPHELAQEVLAIRESPAFEYLKKTIEVGSDGTLRFKGMDAEATGHPSSLNGAFFAMALFRFLNRQDFSNMSAEEKFGFYWNLGGMGTAVTGDGVELAKTIGQLMSPDGAVERSLQALKIVGRAFEGANMGFMTVAVGLDAYELATTNDPVQRAGLTIGLTFNSAALGVQTGGMALGWFFPAVAEAGGGLGLLSVPLMGVGIGAAALGTQIAEHNQEVHQFYHYFIEYFKARDGGVYEEKNGVLVPIAHNVPIAEVNYRTKKIVLGNVRLEKSDPPRGGWIQIASGAVPHQTREYFDVLRPEGKIVPLNGDVAELELSNARPVNISYEYIYSAISESAQEKGVDKRIEAAGAFEPSNSWGNLRPQIKLHYQTGTQNVVLDEAKRVLRFVPDKSGKGPHYVIEGGRGDYMLHGLHANLDLTLKDGNQGPSSFLLHVPDEELLGENAVRLIISGTSRKLFLQCKGGVLEIDISGLDPHSKITISGAGRTAWKVESDKVQINMLDLRTPLVPDVESYLRDMAAKEKLADAVVLIQGAALPNFPREEASAEEVALYRREVESVQERSIRTIYDTKNHRILRPGSDYPQLFSLQGEEFWVPWEGIHFVGLTEKHAFFFDPKRQRLIQTDSTTNREIASFQIRFCSPQSRIAGVAEINGEFVVKQIVPLASGDPAVLLHVLKEDGIQLVEVSELDQTRFERFVLFPQDFLNDIQRVHDEGDVSARETNLLEVLARQLQFEPPQNVAEQYDSFRGAKPAEWVKMRGIGKNGKSQAVLLNLQKGYSVPVNGDGEELHLVNSWSYPPSIGGMGLVLWSPKTKMAHFVKLEPGTFNPVPILLPTKDSSRVQRQSKPHSTYAHRQLSYGVNPPARFHRLAAGRQVVPFEKHGVIYLVSNDGTTVTALDPYGVETSWQYRIRPLPEAKPIAPLSAESIPNSPEKALYLRENPTRPKNTDFSEAMAQHTRQRLIAA